jgi:hypothetical protein
MGLPVFVDRFVRCPSPPARGQIVGACGMFGSIANRLAILLGGFRVAADLGEARPEIGMCPAVRSGHVQRVCHKEEPFRQ